jgi:pyrrolidone-carboxylate peptidase
MRILVYGFGPYRGWKTNVTERVLEKIRPMKGLRKKVFKVEFDEKQFQREAGSFKPDVVIGLGQCSRGSMTRLRIERRAQNLLRRKRKEKPVPIRPNGAPSLYSSLKVEAGKHARKSYNARKYVCNYSMYIMLEALQKSNAKFVFIHVPRKFSPARAAQFVEGIIFGQRQSR